MALPTSNMPGVCVAQTASLRSIAPVLGSLFERWAEITAKAEPIHRRKLSACQSPEAKPDEDVKPRMQTQAYGLDGVPVWKRRDKEDSALARRWRLSQTCCNSDPPKRRYGVGRSSSGDP